MDAREALAVLGLSPGARADDVRTAYRRLVRASHPDLTGADPAGRTARLTEAYAIIRGVLRAGDADVVVIDEPHAAPRTPTPPTPPSAPSPSAYDLAVEAELADGDTVALHAPPDEAYAVLFEAAGQIGHIAYFDRSLGIIETIIRFEGGPSCSLFITLQGRAHATEAFCTLESIEATPTPAIRPVVEALVAQLTAPR